MPLDITLTLTLNGGTPQTETFSTAGHSPGDVYDLEILPNTSVTTSGVVPWSVSLYAPVMGGSPISLTASGEEVVLNESSSPIGAGWGIAGVDHLVSISTGVLWFTGSGDWSYFANNGSGGYISPAGNFGTLVQNGGGDYTYTDPHQNTWNFSSAGLLTSVAVPDGQSIAYLYDGSNDLTEVQTPDGGDTTLTYSSGKLQHIIEPGGRTFTLGHSGNELTLITDPDSNSRTLAYGGDFVTSYSDGDTVNSNVYEESFNFVSIDNYYSAVEPDFGVSTWSFDSVAANALAGTPGPATLVNANNQTTTYGLDVSARLLVPVRIVIALVPKLRLCGFWYPKDRFPEFLKTLENRSATAWVAASLFAAVEPKRACSACDAGGPTATAEPTACDGEGPPSRLLSARPLRERGPGC